MGYSITIPIPDDCDCCPETEEHCDCPDCTDDTCPPIMQVTVAGIQNNAVPIVGSCPDCGALNGTFDLEYVGGCIWRFDFGHEVCTGDGFPVRYMEYATQLVSVVSPPATYEAVRYRPETGSSYIQSWERDTLGQPFDCSTLRVLDKVSDSSYCDFFPATISVAAA